MTTLCSIKKIAGRTAMNPAFLTISSHFHGIMVMCCHTMLKFSVKERIATRGRGIIDMSEKSYSQSAESIQNEAFIENVKRAHPQSRATLMAEISAMEKDKKADEKAKQYLKWILKQTEFNFYLALLPKGQGLVLLKQNLKAVLVIGFNRPHQELQSFVQGHDFVLEILNIHSLQKGEGTKMMQKVMNLSNQLHSPITLIVQTEDQGKYFERFGFKTYSALEKENERTMILQND